MQPFSRKVWNKIIYIARVFKSAPDLTTLDSLKNNTTLAELKILKDIIIDTKQYIVNSIKDEEDTTFSLSF
jgi:hypothetical protein